ncbi:MAG TPA: hypothetical protein VI233_11355, partial [Puia sp.]
MTESKRLAELIDKRLYDHITDEENVELEAWANASPTNRQLLERLQPAAIDRLLRSYLEMDDQKVFDEFLARRKKKTRYRIITIALKSAAAAMILFAIGWLGFTTWKAMRSDTLSRSIAKQTLLKTMRQTATRPMLLLDRNNIQYPDSTRPEEVLGRLGHYTFQKRDTRHLAIEWTSQPAENTPNAVGNEIGSDSIFSTFSIPPNTGSW